MSTSIVGQGERPSPSFYDVFCLYCDGEFVPSRDAVIHGNITSVSLQLGYSDATNNITGDDWKRIGIGKPPVCVLILHLSVISHLY